jgi:poly(3-hydroxybutyrate) depolymerase
VRAGRRPIAAAALLAGLLAACGDGAGAADSGPGGGDGAVTTDARQGPDARPVAGCGAAGATSGVHDESMMVRGTARTYLVSVPANYSATTPYALVFAWHGRTSNSAQARAYFGVEAAAAGAAIVVYPQGLGINGPQDTGWDLASDGKDVEFFDSMLAALESEYCIDTTRVFSTGHSFGGFMSNQVACARGDVVRAIAPVAGGGPYGSCAAGSTPALVIHGSSDTTVVPAMGQGSRDHWLSANGCGSSSSATNPAPCVAYDGCGDAPVHWCLHDESDQFLGGHTWPSFAAQAIWAFFAAF